MFLPARQPVGPTNHHLLPRRPFDPHPKIKTPKPTRFELWDKDSCHYAEDCVEAQTDTDIVLDLNAIKALLDSRMPLLWDGKSVRAAELPWPPEV
jgi:hypothetical protein